MRKYLFAIVALAITATIVAHASPTDAATFYNRGVKDVDYAWADDTCVPGVLPCTPNAGDGDANVLRIVQEPAQGGGLEFGGYETTAIGDDHIWFAATIAAECRLGYSLSSVRLKPEWVYDSYQIRSPEQIEFGWTGQTISIPNGRVMPEKLVAINMPVSAAFDNENGGSLVLDFDTLEEVYAYGESVIADRVASGMTEGAARADGFTFETWVATHARVGCEGNVSGHAFIKKMPQYLPLRIEFVPEAQTPIGGEAFGDDLAVEDSVTDVDLVIVPDPHDACTIHLSGTILANGDLEVDFRFIDTMGGYTPTFTIEVQEGVPAFVSLPVAIPSASGGNEGPSLVAEDDVPDLEDLADHESDLVSGVYQLEVLSPNLISSNIDGYSLPACDSGTIFSLDEPARELGGSVSLF